VKQRALCLALTCSVSILLGCGTIRKQKECGDLISKVNAALQELQAIDTSSGNVQMMEKVAQTADKQAKQLDAVKISSPELKPLFEQYVNMWKDMGRYAHEAAAAAKKGDLNQLNEATTKLKAATGKEDGLVDSMNRACGRS
jgi:methyl-accepting chemotaxis protein